MRWQVDNVVAASSWWSYKLPPHVSFIVSNWQSIWKSYALYRLVYWCILTSSVYVYSIQWLMGSPDSHLQCCPLRLQRLAVMTKYCSECPQFKSMRFCFWQESVRMLKNAAFVDSPYNASFTEYRALSSGSSLQCPAHCVCTAHTPSCSQRLECPRTQGLSMSNTLIVCRVFNTRCLHTPHYSQCLKSVSHTKCKIGHCQTSWVC